MMAAYTLTLDRDKHVPAVSSFSIMIRAPVSSRSHPPALWELERACGVRLQLEDAAVCREAARCAQQL
jgi:hypothetical protein